MNTGKPAKPLCRRLAAILFFLSIAYAPWAWACIRPAFLHVLEQLLGLSFVLLLPGWIRPTGRAPFPRILKLCIGWILLQGWFLVFNAKSVYNAATHQLVPIHPWFGFLPGASDRNICFASMLHVTVLLMALPVAWDLMGCSRCRKFIFQWMALVAATVAGYGVAARWGWLPAMVSRPSFPTSPFGPFNYHGAAGAFLNLAVPLQIGLAAIEFRQPRRPVYGGIFAAAAGITLLGLLVNVSRGAVLIGLLQTILLAFLLLRLHLRQPRPLVQSATQTAAIKSFRRPVLILCCGVGITAIAFGSLLINPRWHSFGKYFDTLHSSRVLAWRVAWGMVTSHPVLGTGAGSFKLRFPISHHWLPDLYSHWVQTFYRPGHHVSQWSYASNDYLQNLVQFGFVGALAWMGLLWGWLLPHRRPQSVRRMHGPESYSDTVLFYCVMTALLGVYCHAAFDYPLEIAPIQLCTVVCLAAIYRYAAGEGGNGQARHPEASGDFGKTADFYQALINAKNTVSQFSCSLAINNQMPCWYT